MGKKRRGAVYDPGANSYMKMHNDAVFAKRRNAVIAAVICLLFAVILIARYVINEQFVARYRQGIYDAGRMDVLFQTNIVEPYVPFYNVGNYCYLFEEYELAADYFYRALNSAPPHGRNGGAECDIRVNLALSVCYQIDFAHIASAEDANAAIEILLTARAFLTEAGCANEQAGIFDGHSETAEGLKYEIDSLIEMLQNPQGSASQSASGNASEDEKKEDPPPPMSEEAQSDIRDQLKEEMGEAGRTLQEQEDRRARQDNPPDQQKRYW